MDTDHRGIKPSLVNNQQGFTDARRCNVYTRILLLSTRSHNGAALSYYFYIRAVKKMYCFFLFRVVSWRDDVTHVSITWEMFFVYYSKARSDVFLMRQNEQGNVIVRDRETTLNCLISFIWIWCFPSIVQNRAPTLLSFYTLHVSKSTLLPHASTVAHKCHWY